MTLTLDGVTAGYGRTQVLYDVGFAPMEPGGMTGLIGPNASGKSTLFRVICGLVRPTAGTARIGEQDLFALPRRARAGRVAYMPQNYGCNALLTVFESVLLALKQSGSWRVSGMELGRVSDTLAALGLSELSERGIGALSGGQAQMVAAAQALVRDPEIMLLDEPTSALDLHHQLSIMHAVRGEVRRRGTVAIAALHDLNLAAKFCDRLVLLGQGRVLAEGAPAAILAHPELGRTYGVATRLERTGTGGLYVDAQLAGAT